jgi:prepilin-type N-terminal cleavage/methylation domain-containing protein
MLILILLDKIKGRLMHSICDNKAFSLAEVLITLLIVGIIASIVIPNIIQDTQDAQYRVAGKKIYSTLDQATRRILSDNAGTMIDFATFHDSARDKYLQYISATKKCSSYLSSGAGYCGDEFCNYFIETGLGGNCSGGGGGFAVLSDGTFMLIYAGGGAGDPHTCSPVCSYINIDTNGFKGPNELGKDMLKFKVIPTQLVPYGSVTQNIYK